MPVPTTISIGDRNEVIIQDATPRNGLTGAFAGVVWAGLIEAGASASV